MKRKNELLKECIELMATPKVEKWYAENLETKPQVLTISSLMLGITNNEITVKEALAIALIVGVEWDTKFEGVP